MGYLTDPSGFHGKPFRMILNHQGKICTLFYLSSLIWYCLLSHDQINSGTYLSENALLPGLVVVEYNQDDLAKNLINELEYEANTHSSIPKAWIKAKLAQSGLQVFTQNFTLNHPLRPNTKYVGENVYGILRGGGASTEAIVLSVPYRSPNSAFASTSGGLALVLSIAHYFRRQKYWAKDIIFLFTEHEQLGAQAWLEAYHGVTCGTPGVLVAGELDGRGGSIQAAVNLELASLGTGGARFLDVKLAGLNGQLPNLDLYNLVHRICNKERIPHTFDKREKAYTSPYFSKKYLDSFLTMGSMVVSQASGVPDGNHGLYHRFGIESVTIEGYRGSRGTTLSYHQVGRVIEGVFRSINNLLERFHQSYFFYLLADYDRFVSIGYYMPCVGLLAGALFIKAFKVYLTLRSIWIDQLNASSDKTQEYPNLNSVGTGIAIMISYLLGLLVYSAPPVFIEILPFLSTEDSIFYGYLFTGLATVVVPMTLSERFGSGKEEWYLIEMCLEVLLATLLIVVSMHNFSLAFVVGILIVPSFLLLKSKGNGYIRRLLILCCHPLVVLTGCVVCLSELHHGNLSKVLPGVKGSLTLAIVDTHVYSSSTLTLATLFYLPNWTMAWLLAQS